MTTSFPLRRNDKPVPVYALGQLSIRDRGRYQHYVRRFHDVLERFGGKLLAADESPEILEGSWERKKVVLLAFESAESFWAWARSDEYQEISRDRTAATDGTVLLIHGAG